MPYISLFAALRRGIPRLAPSAGIVLERGLLISNGGDIYAGTGEIADWLGDDDRRNAQRIRSSLIGRGLLIAKEQRRRENGADSVLVCECADRVLAIYRHWREARDSARAQRRPIEKPPIPPTTECHRADDKMSPALESEAKREEIQDSKTKRDPVRLTPPHDSSKSGCVAPRPRKPAEGPNPFARQHWLRKLNAFIGERLSGPQQWSGWDLVARAEAGALIDRAERRQLDDIDRAMRGCGYRATA